MKKNLDYYLSLNYQMVIRRDKDGTYFIEYPDLPGCMSCAPTLEEVIKSGEDAKRAWLETALEEGIEIPEPNELNDYSGNFRLRLPKTLHRNLAKTAEKEGISMNQYCVYLLSREFERNIKR